MTSTERELLRRLVDAAARARAARIIAAEERCRDERFAMRREARGLPPIVYRSGCAGCGCAFEQRTPGCRSCTARHANYRKRPASTRRGVAAA